MQNNLQLIIFLVVIGFSALQWIARKLQEQAAIKKAQEARARARLEALRTGRPDTSDDESSPPTSPDDAVRDRLQELAERRRRQIEAMRRQQGQSTQTAGSPPGTPSTGPATLSPPRATPQPLPTPLRPAPIRRPQPQANAPVRSPFPRPTPTRPLPDRRRTAADVVPGPTLSLRDPPPLTADAATKPTVLAPPMLHADRTFRKPSRQELRRTIILREILDPPIALRGPATDPVSGPVSRPDEAS